MPNNQPERHIPRVEQSWTIGTVLAASLSGMSLLSVILGMTWGYARVTYTTEAIPTIMSKQEILRTEVEVLKTQRVADESKYKEILYQLNKISDKVDRLSDSKVDKQMKEWTR